MTYHQRWLISLLILVMGMLVACGEEQPATSEEESVNTIATHIANGGRVTRNQDWIWQEQEFDGVVMVLVPPGCFMMGSTEHPSQQPVHEQCFDTSFWIDKYEVTQYEFDQFNGKKAELNFFSGGARPVEIITWFEARDYCALRGGRLPTEREWEYAARGPSNLTYPWGNEFLANNVVYVQNSNGQTAIVGIGNRSGYASWVGAVDMIGNVSEWVSSLYVPYPYSINSENDADTQTDRVYRGGAWAFPPKSATSRDWQEPRYEHYTRGFRCARSE